MVARFPAVSVAVHCTTVIPRGKEAVILAVTIAVVPVALEVISISPGGSMLSTTPGRCRVSGVYVAIASRITGSGGMITGVMVSRTGGAITGGGEMIVGGGDMIGGGVSWATTLTVLLAGAALF